MCVTKRRCFPVTVTDCPVFSLSVSNTEHKGDAVQDIALHRIHPPSLKLILIDQSTVHTKKKHTRGTIDFGKALDHSIS